MSDFKRLAEIDIRVDTAGAEKGVRHAQNLVRRSYQAQIDANRKLQQNTKMSVQKRADLRMKLAKLKEKWAKWEVAIQQQANKKLEAKQKAHTSKLAALDKVRASNKKKLLRRLVYLEKKAARDAVAVNRKKNADIMASDRRTRGRRRGGLSPIAGVGPTGGFGFMMGSGGAGYGMLGAYMGIEGIKSTTSAYLEQEEAIGRLMSLVSRHEQQMGFTWGIARDEAQKLARDLGITIPDAARAMREAVTAAVEPIRSPEFVRGAAAMALSEGVAIPELTSMLAAVGNAYEMTADEMERLPDIIFTTMDEGLFKVGQMKSQLGDLAGIARATGFGLKETMAAMGALTRGGMKGARAATGLRMLGSLILKGPSGKVQQRREAVGLDLQQSAQMGGLKQVMEDMKKAVADGRYNIAELTGGRIQALKALTMLLGSQNDSFYEILAKIQVSHGRAAEEAAKLLDNSANRMKRFGQTINTVMADIGQGFAEAFAETLGSGDEFEENMEAIVTHMKVLTGLLPDLIEGFGRVRWMVTGTVEGIHAGSKGLGGWIDDLRFGRATHEADAAEDKRVRDLQAAATLGFLSGADFDEWMNEQRRQQKIKAEADKEAQLDTERKAEAHAQRLIDIEMEQRVVAAKVRKKLWGEQEKMVLDFQKRLQALAETRRDFWKTEEERLEKASLKGRDQTPLEKFTRAYQKMEDAKRRAETARDPKEARTALREMGQQTAAIRGMDLGEVWQQIMSGRAYEARAGMADITPSMTFAEKYKARRGAREQIQLSKEALRQGRRTRGGLEEWARLQDVGVGVTGREVFEGYELGWDARRQRARGHMRALETIDPGLKPDTRPYDERALAGGVIDLKPAIVYDQPITVNQNFYGEADPEDVEAASTKGIKTALDRGAGNIEPNK